MNTKSLRILCLIVFGLSRNCAGFIISRLKLQFGSYILMWSPNVIVLQLTSHPITNIKFRLFFLFLCIIQKQSNIHAPVIITRCKQQANLLQI